MGRHMNQVSWNWSIFFCYLFCDHPVLCHFGDYSIVYLYYSTLFSPKIDKNREVTENKIYREKFTPRSKDVISKYI